MSATMTAPQTETAASGQTHAFPKLHNAMWPGVVGKGGGGDAEPPIALADLLRLTAAAEVDGVRFDGVDLFLADPHTSIDSTRHEIQALADTIGGMGLAVGSLVAPVWPPVGGGAAMGDAEERAAFLAAVEKSCRIGQWLREAGVRPSGVVRIDTATGVDQWSADPEAATDTIVETFNAACDIAEGYGERLAAEGEICWGGMHSWRAMVALLEAVGRPETLGFQADMAHTLLYTLGANAPEARILPENFAWDDPEALDAAYRQVADALRPWTIDFHVAQNDGTVFGSGSHDKTGRHCPVTDPNGRLDVVKHAGFWLRGDDGEPTRAFRHICWDGCMFPNATMLQQQTWNDVLGAMIAVRDAHGWN
jgi:sugar phosphate isomerase/epimerase